MSGDQGRPQPLAAFAAAYDARVRELAQREGTAPCTEPGCSAQTGVPCEYADRRSRSCGTAWCPEHRVLVEDHAYCRRHAGVVSALPNAESSLVVPLPDLNNRAPSLVAWVARQLDGEVWKLLLSEMDARSGGQLVADPVMLVFTGIERERAWERAWKLVTHTGISRRVSLMVLEDKDDEVLVKVGPNVVTRLVPPWITHRVRGERVDTETDLRERDEFNTAVMQAVEQGVMAERARGGEA